MYEQEKIIPYNGKGEKSKLVEEMFDKIAPTYDTLNHRLSWDIDKGWQSLQYQLQYQALIVDDKAVVAL